jgi:hypothetical protein
VELNLPDSLEAIGDFTFYGCSGLVELNLPDSLTSIGSYTFSGCPGLVELNLPNSLATMDDSTFSGCSGLVELNLPDSLTAIGHEAFGHCSKLVELNLPDSLTAIGSYAFSCCSGLVELHLPNSLAAIDEFTFYSCSRLVELNLPRSLTSIGSQAFSDCRKLRVLILPPALASLDATAFDGSTINLRRLVVPATVPVEVATTMAGMLGPKVKPSHENDEGAAVSNGQLVSVPDAVVASMGGVFANMSTMTEVRAAGRAISGVVEQRYWTARAHMHHVCPYRQRACAHALLLVGVRLYSRSAPCFAMAPDRSTQVGAPEPWPLLALPDELWVLVLGWLRWPELGPHQTGLERGYPRIWPPPIGAGLPFYYESS